MQHINTQIQTEVGLHARPAAQFVKLAKQFKSTITITYNNKTASAKSLILLLGLGIPSNGEIELITDGEDEVEAIQALTSLIESNFSQ